MYYVGMSATPAADFALAERNPGLLVCNTSRCNVLEMERMQPTAMSTARADADRLVVEMAERVGVNYVCVGFGGYMGGAGKARLINELNVERAVEPDIGPYVTNDDEYLSSDEEGGFTGAWPPNGEFPEWTGLSCARCGRDTHTRLLCSAQRHANGHILN